MTIEIINHTDEDVAITNFDVARYSSAAYMEREWQGIWRRHWLLAGLASDVAQTGDYFVFDLGREQILVTRDEAGQLQAFFNVCQHRGNRLVTAERGQAQRLRCSYHAWTYGLDGALASVPYEERFANGVPCAERSLRKVHTDAWGGFVFVCLDEEPEPLLDYLGPVATMLAPYQFDKMVLMEDQTVLHRCNWKAVIDNFSELYHVDFLHPQHKRMVDCCNDTVHLFDRGHTGLEVPGATVSPRFAIPDEPTDLQSAQLSSLGLDPADFRGRVLDVRAAVQQAKRDAGDTIGIDYSAFNDEQLSDVWQFNLFPNTVLSFTPEHCWVMRVRPHASDPQRCAFDKLSLLRFADGDHEVGGVVGPGREAAQSATRLAADYQRPERDEFDHHAILRGDKTMTDTIDQDIELLGDVQAGMVSQGFDSVWLSDDEMRIQHFHNAVEAALAGSPAVPSAPE